MEQLPPPVISPSSGVYDLAELKVEITAPNAIVYTADGSTPKLVHYSQPYPPNWASRGQCSPWRNTFFSPIKISVNVPGEVKARAFTVRDGKEVLSDVAVATYVWSKVQFGIIVSCSAQPKPHTWRVHYAYRSDDGEQHETIVVVGQDIPTWVSSDIAITVPTPPGVTGIMKLECPPLVKWSTFGIGNQKGSRPGESFFLADQ